MSDQTPQTAGLPEPVQPSTGEPTAAMEPIEPTPVQPAPLTPAPVTPTSPLPANPMPAAAAAVAPATATGGAGGGQPVWPTPPGALAEVPDAGLPAVVDGKGMATSSSAIVAFVLAIASWVVCPLILAIVALVFAAKADREVAAAPDRVSGSGLITAAKIVSWINIGVSAAGIIVGLFILGLALLAGGFSHMWG